MKNAAPLRSAAVVIDSPDVVSNSVSEGIAFTTEFPGSSEKKYRDLFNALPDVVMNTDMNGTIHIVNPACFSFFGYTPEEMIGRSMKFFYEDESQRGALLKALSHKDVLTNYPIRFITKSGAVKTGSVNIKIVYDSVGNAIGLDGLIRDITEKVQADKEIEQAKEFYETILNAIASDIAVFKEENKYCFLNKNAVKNDALRTWLIGKDDFEYCKEKGRDTALAKTRWEKHALVTSTNKPIEWLEESFDTKGNKHYEIRILKPFQTADGNKFKVGYGLDITKLKTTKLQLAERESYLRSLLDSIPDTIFRVNRQGVFIDGKIDPRAKEILRLDDFVGKNLHEVLLPEMALFHMRHIESALEGDQLITYEFPVYQKDGSTVYLEARINRKSDDEVVIIIRDMTEKNKLQTQLDQELELRQRKITTAVIQAQEAERAIIGQELHDNVNQVLTTVKLYTELCLDGNFNNIALLDKSVHLLNASINEIRALSKRLSAPTLGNILLKDSISELVDAINDTNKLEIRLHADDLENHEVNPEIHMAVYRIFQEHFTNILKHAEAQYVDVFCTKSESDLQIRVIDGGKGFDPIKRRKGIGITNMISRAESVKGELVIESSPGHGCTLAVRIPLGYERINSDDHFMPAI
ncbi:MAG: PAS domain S-box protein [Chitinophagaceae bacterium]